MPDGTRADELDPKTARDLQHVGCVSQLVLPANTSLISEILDSRTKSVASVASVNDYVTSNNLISMALAMVSEQREVNLIFRELFAAWGNDIVVHNSSLYLKPGSEASFFELMAIAKQKNHLPIGYRVSEITSLPQ
jgi:ion channel POLLUX/CASTOR